MQNRIQITQISYVSPAAAPFFRLFGQFLIAIAVLAVGSGIVHAINNQSWIEFYSKLKGASVLGLVGYGCWVLADRIRRSRLAQVERFKKYPHKPWLWREDWAAKRIFVNEKLPKVLLTLFVLGSVFALYVAFRYGHAKPNGGFLSWPVVGTVVVLWMGVHVYRLNRRWRRSELRIETLPGRIGGEFRGTIWLSEQIDPSTTFLAYLSCEEMIWHRKASARRSGLGIITKILWSTEREIQASCEGFSEGKTPIALAFNIPVQLEPTTMDEHPTSEDFDLPKGLARRIEWWLMLKPHDRNDSRSIRFCIPVFIVRADLPKRKRKRSS